MYVRVSIAEDRPICHLSNILQFPITQKEATVNL